MEKNEIKTAPNTSLFFGGKGANAGNYTGMKQAILERINQRTNEIIEGKNKDLQKLQMHSIRKSFSDEARTSGKNPYNLNLEREQQNAKVYNYQMDLFAIGEIQIRRINNVGVMLNEKMLLQAIENTKDKIKKETLVNILKQWQSFPKYIPKGKAPRKD